MTDAEVIKAKAHFEYGIKCDIFSEPVLSYAETVLEAFDLINRQKAEIELLNKAIKVLEIMTEQHAYDRRKAAAEAIKEFAQRLKYRLTEYPECYFSERVTSEDIDNIVKEITGELGF